MYHQRIEESSGRHRTNEISSDESDADSAVYAMNGPSGKRKLMNRQKELWKSSDADEIVVLP